LAQSQLALPHSQVSHSQVAQLQVPHSQVAHLQVAQPQSDA
jgi:hypothetical protein